MQIFRVLMKKGAKEYDDVPECYWREAFFHKIWLLLRGIRWSVLLKESGKMFSVGKHTQINNASYMVVKDKVQIGRDVKIQAFSKIGITLSSNVQIGDYSIINGTSLPNDIGIGLRIGENSAFGEFCYFGCAGGIEIGSNVIGGQNIRFHSENHLYADLDLPIFCQGATRKGIVGGDNCWIGAGAVFLDGVVLGNGCVVAANAVLNKEYPPNSVIAGVPGKVIKKRECS